MTLGGGVAAIAQALVAPGPNKVAFPADWAKGTMYGTVDRPDTKQYRELYTSAESLAAVRAGKPIPDGTVLTLAAYMAQVDANGVPLKDANGRFINGNLAAVNVMQKGKGWGEDIPAAVRNGDWVYQSFTPDGKVNDKANLTACYQCHLPLSKVDYLTNLAKLQGKFPSQAAAVVKSGPADVTVAGFAFGPNAIKVSAGQAVTWTNNDDTPHQITLTARLRALRHPRQHQQRRHAAPDHAHRRQQPAQRGDAQGPECSATVRRRRQHRLHLRPAPDDEGHDRGRRQELINRRCARRRCARCADRPCSRS